MATFVEVYGTDLHYLSRALILSPDVGRILVHERVQVVFILHQVVHRGEIRVNCQVRPDLPRQHLVLHLRVAREAGLAAEGYLLTPGLLCN